VPDKKTTNPRHKRREDAVAAAARVFSERGYQGASTRHIAQELGIRQGSLYYYFNSKDKALEEVCCIGIEEIVQAIEAIAASEVPADEKIRLAIQQHLGYLDRGRHFMRTFLFSRHLLPEHRRGRVRLLSEQYEQLIESVFTSGVSTGVFRPDLDCWVATQSFFALINVAAAGYKPSQQRSLKQLEQGFCQQLLEGAMTRPC